MMEFIFWPEICILYLGHDFIYICASWWNASWHISMQGFIVKKTPAHITILEILSSCCVLYLLAELHDSEYTVWVASMAATWPPRDDIIHAGLFSGYQKVNFISSLRPRRHHPQVSSIPWWLVFAWRWCPLTSDSSISLGLRILFAFLSRFLSCILHESDFEYSSLYRMAVFPSIDWFAINQLYLRHFLLLEFTLIPLILPFFLSPHTVCGERY